MNDMISPRIFDKALHALRFDIYGAKLTHPDSEVVELADQLLEKGKQIDLLRLQESVEVPYNGIIERNFDAPTDYTDLHVIDQPWSDPEAQPLKEGEVWNRFNRASNTNIPYAFDENNHPINPFFNYGVKGRGVIGHFGPNHAVDMGPCRLMRNEQGKMALYVLGIVREDNGLPALCGGFVNFERYQTGLYPFSKRLMYQTQTHEFFEEMISGSVELLPEYAKGLDQEIAMAIEQRHITQKNQVSEKQKAVIAHELTTQRKLKQVEQEDPQFLKDIFDCFESAKECYAGPVLSSARNTNTSWMETKLSWFILDEAKWEYIKGNNKFNYDFAAGDDAQAVQWHEITPELIDNSGNHGALFCYLLSSYLTTTGKAHPDVLLAVKNQAKQLLDHAVKPVFMAEKLKM